MNINQIMKQAQQMQKKLADAQAQIDAMEMQGTAGNGLVSITFNGKGMASNLKIDPSLIDPQDPEMLCDLVVAAINNAAAKKEDESAKKMAEASGGLKLPPGLKLPF